jgi:hypothetical protein
MIRARRRPLLTLLRTTWPVHGALFRPGLAALKAAQPRPHSDSLSRIVDGPSAAVVFQAVRGLAPWAMRR